MSTLVYVIVLFMIVITALAALRSRVFQLRRIAAYAAMPLSISEAVESDKGVHVSFGSSAVRETSTISAIASAGVLYYLAERAAFGDRPPLVTLSDPITLGLGLDALRRAYKAAQSLRKFRVTMAHWYPQGPQAMAFAAGAGSDMLDENIATNVLVGRFGPELMLLAENAIRFDRSIIAQSDQIDGQAVGYVISDMPLIGEELYAASAYLARSPLTIGGVVAQDILRYALIALIIGLFFLAILGTNF